MNYDDLLRELKTEAVSFPDISTEDLADIIHALKNHFDVKKLVEYKASGVSELTEWQKGWNDAIDTIMDETPIVNVVSVVRCKDCKHYNEYLSGFGGCEIHKGSIAIQTPFTFCAWAERREDAID